MSSGFQSPLPWSSCPVVNGTPVSECVKSSETAYFWYRNTLDAAPSMDDSGGLKWWIVLCLLLSWIMVFLIVMKGIQSSGKVLQSIFFGNHFFISPLNFTYGFRWYTLHPCFLTWC